MATDSYQPIYDAVRASIHGGNVAEVVAEEVRRAFDISFAVEAVKQELSYAAAQHSRPSVAYRPTLSADGDMWCALLGDDLQSGFAAFGKTPAEAMLAFDSAFYSERTPTAIRIEREQVSA